MFVLDIDPYTIIASSFLILFFQKLISLIGKARIRNFIWHLYINYLSQSKSIKQYNSVQLEIRQLSRQQKLTSASDEYAKWTKLNRSLDKLKLEAQQLNETISGEKTRVDQLTNLLITLMVTLPIWILRIFCRKVPLFYLRKGILPYYLEWALALPFFKTGTIGLTCWIFVANSVLSNLLVLITFPFEPSVAKPVKPKENIEEKNVEELKERGGGGGGGGEEEEKNKMI
ncbi:GET1 [Candida oxycetoniae]|uniref:Golgi to ER traffic protein 1 n=1 Tax=Candida oxycetoniae TaxID=497107 RepID=A0AAI9WVI5_9ASCO|nr:GET1 [Candida oxycetoniae]KAI3402374.2 GET1 [Candida oxycetoniae]